MLIQGSLLDCFLVSFILRSGANVSRVDSNLSWNTIKLELTSLFWKSISQSWRAKTSLMDWIVLSVIFLEVTSNLCFLSMKLPLMVTILGRWSLMSVISVLLFCLPWRCLLMNTLSIKVAVLLVMRVGLVIQGSRFDSRLNSMNCWLLLIDTWLVRQFGCQLKSLAFFVTYAIKKKPMTLRFQSKFRNPLWTCWK